MELHVAQEDLASNASSRATEQPPMIAKAANISQEKSGHSLMQRIQGHSLMQRIQRSMAMSRSMMLSAGLGIGLAIGWVCCSLASWDVLMRMSSDSCDSDSGPSDEAKAQPL